VIVFRFIWQWLLPIWGILALGAVAWAYGAWHLPSFDAPVLPTPTITEHLVPSPDGEWDVVYRQSTYDEDAPHYLVGSQTISLITGGEEWFVASLEGTDGVVIGPPDTDPRYAVNWLSEQLVQISYCGVGLTVSSNIAVLPRPSREYPEPSLSRVEIEFTRRPDCDVLPPDPWALDGFQHGSTSYISTRADGDEE
jgi:hypothetical protein